jgi:regulator of telomere elongation helicase 1
VIADLGHTIADICSCVTGGILVFFSSYSLMRQYLDEWTDLKIIDTISSLKKVFVESSEAEVFKEDLARYNDEVKKNFGAIFMGVCRGKLSEGIDFSDDAARCVIMISIPYS